MGEVLLDLKEKYFFLSLNLLLTSGNQHPAEKTEESTASEQLSHVQWDIVRLVSCWELSLGIIGHAGQIHPSTRLC